MRRVSPQQGSSFSREVGARSGTPLTPVRSQTQFGEVRAAMAAVDAQCGRQLSGSRGLGTPLHPP